MVRHRGLVFDLWWNAKTDRWVADRTDATDDGEAVLIVKDGATPEEALDACHVVAEHVTREGELPDDERDDPF